MRGLLLWVGTSGVAMSIVSAVVLYLWTRLVSLPGPVGFLAAAAGLVLVSALFAVVRYLVGSDLSPSLVPLKVLDRHGRNQVTALGKTPTKKRTVARICASLVVILLFCLALYTKAVDKWAAGLRPDTAIFMECDMSSLPISPPSGGKAHVILLNKKRIEGTKGQRWGFYEVSQEWPDKKMLKKSEQAHNLGMFCYRCKVSNHGPTNVIYLGIRIDLWFGNQGGEQNKITYAPVISAIDSGRDAEFYLVNACNVLVSAIWQTTARAQLLGEAKQRDISLMRAYRSPVDQIMMFFPATVNWSGEVCE